MLENVKTKLGWTAKYVEKEIKQYPFLQPETNIGVLGNWDNFKLSQNLPLIFSVGSSGVNLVNGNICLDGRWYPSPPNTRPQKLIYYRIHAASINGGADMTVNHFVGYECFDHSLKVCVPDNGDTPTINIER
jgi:hypothetical protein